MAEIIGDYTGTTWDDFLVLPDITDNEERLTPERVNLSTDLAGVKLKMPFLSAAMRSVTGKDLALAGGKLGMMAVAPRGLSIEREAGIVKYVKENAVGVGDIEYEIDPTTARDDDTLRIAIGKALKTGHSNIPVLTKDRDFVGMFHYDPLKHNQMASDMLITRVMQPYKKGGKKGGVDVCKIGMSDDEIKQHLRKIYDRDKTVRFVPLVDDVGRFRELVFLQTSEAYKVGAAVDTHKGWEKRTGALIDAGADIIFIDTSDAHKPFSRDVLEGYKKLAETIEKYKKMGSNLPPVCGGNIVTAKAFDYLVDYGADIIKLGMGPGSICTTNEVIGVGAPPFWSVVEVARRRKERSEKGKYIPIIADGGIENTHHMAVALTYADAIMGGKIFACFFESEGERYNANSKPLPREGRSDEGIEFIRIYGEGSEEAMAVMGDIKRYSTPSSKKGKTATFQGVSGLLRYKGFFKPGVEGYYRTIQETLYHVGAPNLESYREKATLIRLSERAKITAAPHGIELIE